MAGDFILDFGNKLIVGNKLIDCKKDKLIDSLIINFLINSLIINSYSTYNLYT